MILTATVSPDGKHLFVSAITLNTEIAFEQLIRARILKLHNGCWLGSAEALYSKSGSLCMRI